MTPEENARRLGQALWDANAELETLRAKVERIETLRAFWADTPPATWLAAAELQSALDWSQ